MFLTDKAIVSDHEDWYSYPQNQNTAAHTEDGEREVETGET